jgi:membrane protein implicated in regulation of membrane protease activity
LIAPALEAGLDAIAAVFGYALVNWSADAACLAAIAPSGAVRLYRVITVKIVIALLWIGYRYLRERGLYDGVTRAGEGSGDHEVHADVLGR